MTQTLTFMADSRPTDLAGDSRFAHARFDPRFKVWPPCNRLLINQRAPRKKKTVQLDERFQKMLKDKNFSGQGAFQVIFLTGSPQRCARTPTERAQGGRLVAFLSYG